MIKIKEMKNNKKNINSTNTRRKTEREKEREREKESKNKKKEPLVCFSFLISPRLTLEKKTKRNIFSSEI